MKVICAGFWKTGTKSLARALRILGYKVYDYDDQYFLLCDLWDKFFNGTVTDDDIKERLEDVDVLIDGPVIAFWEEIYKAIPDAKVVLTARNEDAWYRSYKGMIDKNPRSIVKYLFILLYFTPTGRGFVRNALRVAAMLLSTDGPLSMPFLRIKYNPRLYKNLYRKHNSHVIQQIPQESLLVYQSSDGWGPLCEFLGEEVPKDTPYPHLNKDGAHFNTEGGPTQPMFKRALVEMFFLLAIIVGVVAFIAYIYLT